MDGELERAYWLAWSQIKDVGPVLIKRLRSHFGTLGQAWQVDAADLLSVDGIGLVSADKIVGLRSQICPQQLLEQHEARYPQFWTPADSEYPRLLWEIPDPPPVLYYRGPWRPNTLASLTVAMVGTRHPSPYGRRWTQRLSRHLSQRQITIVSGLAAGIDTYAHQSCLDSDGHTIAVLGTGVDVVYPRSNRPLYQRILETGLLVSEYADGTPPDRGHFPRRNRIIAGLSHATLVTEAPERSGALITAQLANDYGRHIYALPNGLDHPTGRGCLNLINNGAAPVLGEESLFNELTNLAHLGVTPSSQSPTESKMENDAISSEPPPAPAGLDPVDLDTLNAGLRQIFQAMPPTPITLDKLQETTQLDTSVLLSGLLNLELMELITQLPGGQYQRN